MIEKLVSWVATSFKVKKLIAKRIVMAAIVLAVASLCVVTKKCYDNRIISQYEQAQQLEAVTGKSVADEKASDQRAEDIIRDTQNAEKREEAIDEATDEPLSDSSLKLGCERLRQQGYDTSNYAECK